MNVMLTFLLFLCCFLQGCEKKDNLSDLKKFIETTKQEHKKDKVALPELSLERHEYYSASALRNPFAPSAKKAVVTIKKKDPLLNYPIDSLQLIGVLAKGKDYWAAIMLPSGHILEVGVGARLGLNEAKVESITQHHVKLKEHVVTASGKNQTREIFMEITKGT